MCTSINHLGLDQHKLKLVLSRYCVLQASYLVSPSSPHMDLDEFEKRAETIFKEYFDHGDPQEVAASLEEFNIRNIKHEVSSNIKIDF